MPRILIHFARLGPYHHARLQAAELVLKPLDWEVLGFETAGHDATYAWSQTNGGPCGPQVVTAFPGRVHEGITSTECRQVLHPLLSELQPDAMVIAGWAAKDAAACLSWCRRHKVPCFVMSETREADGQRVWWKEWIKRWVISRFDGALVGGNSHRDYLVKLGMASDKIALGYNVVDNSYFAGEAASWKLRHLFDRNPVGRPCFLASNRFVERKNLSRLIAAFSGYIRTAVTSGTPLWNLCLLGDGELKSSLIKQCHSLDLLVTDVAPWEGTELPPEGDVPRGHVFFPGFRQIEELPRFYAGAACFVHPALEEPWGLVINEAMASGLPVISSNNVGAAETLVDAGVNGWTFDAQSVDDIARCLLRIASLSDEERAAFGLASARIIEERCPTRAFGTGLVGLLQ